MILTNQNKDTYNKPCHKCGALGVIRVLNYYYCNRCWLNGEHVQPPIENIQKPKRKHIKKTKN